MRSMTLDDWLKKQNEGDGKLSDAQFGERIGLSQSQISRLRRCKSRPSWKTMDAVHAATQGLVKPNAEDWPVDPMEVAE